MKYVLQTLRSCSQDGHEITCTADGGILVLTFYSTRMLYVSYQFEDLKTPDCLEAANKMLKGAPPVSPSLSLSFEDTGGAFVVHASDGPERMSVSIAKEGGNLVIERNGRRISGGVLGNDDTVIPRTQVRAFRRKGDASWFARLNFPTASGDAFFGLGDKTGKPDRFGRRFRMFNRDALGYDAAHNDPLYKSIPFFLKQNRREKTVAGYYFPEALIDIVDFGCESPFYTYVQLREGPVGYYLFLGDRYEEILASYCAVTGLPELPPLFSFGFFGSSMNYVEPDDAADRILRYFREVEEYGIPCEGMYVSSGYLKADDGHRYAFLWNQRKFPDYASFLSALRKRGYNLTMNIKPGILTTHPWYKELESKGFFLHDNEGNPLVEYYWGGQASFIDFNNSEARKWWKEKLKESYLSHGCTGIWNDNNECELEDPETDAYKVRTLFPLLMCQAAYEAFNEVDPGKRHWIYTRSGYAGIQKYARTWTGDNTSTWETLAYNQFQNIGLGLSGIPFYGNDLGGFFGDVPSRELLVRSCQSGVFQPRFVIHSWRADGKPTEPWTYPEAVGMIRFLIKEHYRFMPYIYSTAYEAAITGKPMDRPLFLEFPDDPDVPTDQIPCMFGPSVLKLLVTDAGRTNVDAYLPHGTVWYDPCDKSVKEGGRTVRFSVPLGTNRYLARIPSVIPTSEGCASLAAGRFPHLVFSLYPGEASCVYRYFEDDGESSLDKGTFAVVRVVLGQGLVTLTVETGTQTVEGERVNLVLPDGFCFATGSQSLSVPLEPGISSFPFSGRYR